MTLADPFGRNLQRSTSTTRAVLPASGSSWAIMQSCGEESMRCATTRYLCSVSISVNRVPSVGVGSSGGMHTTGRSMSSPSLP
eukprot:CAMPEP_0169459362 /NCGR_PEP_ID=MMETSP1042-20121227/17916_1 /TAXON_ID=464988 /ORGANISM="Hemiselmis andersenii, Strain CCMP1180" /LENGTH=82 /DNA_ID=CAMNT_0009571787 /DNA_START=275 /DNA_END=519 /DNA_ORIENTATION=-